MTLQEYLDIECVGNISYRLKWDESDIFIDGDRELLVKTVKTFANYDVVKVKEEATEIYDPATGPVIIKTLYI